MSFIATENTIVGATAYKGSTADVTTIEPSINQVLPLVKNKQINLIGDKGYISAELRDKLKTIGVTLMYPHRKNMIQRTPPESKLKLKKRYTIEMNIQTIKTLNRMLIRRDAKITTYISFIYLALIWRMSKK